MKFLFLLFLLSIFSSQVLAKTIDEKAKAKIKAPHHGHHDSHRKKSVDSKESKLGKPVEGKTDKAFKGSVKVKVKGMVCAFCAQGIKKAFGKIDQVKKTTVNLDNMSVTIQLKKDQQIKRSVIETIITDAGFSFEAATNE